MLDRPRPIQSLLLASLLVAGASQLLACGPEIPDAWKDLVPETKGLDSAIEAAASPGMPDELMLFYARAKTDPKTLASDYAAKIEAAGYTKVMACESDEVPSGGFMKAPKSFVEFSVAPLGEETWDVRLRKTDELLTIGLPEKDGCAWLPEADKFCTSKPTDSCALPQ